MNTTAGTAEAPLLVIEDEPSVMAFIQAALERSGYHVIPVASGAEALRLLGNGRYLGVISDMRTPGGVNGAHVHAWISAHRRDLLGKIIFITGDTVNDETTRLLQETGAPCIEKPFRVQELIRTVGSDLREAGMNGPNLNFLIVDDQQSIRKLCMTIGASMGFTCAEAESAEAAVAYIESHSPEIVLVDLRMDSMNGLEFLAAAKKLLPRSEVAIMTGYGSIENAVHAMKLGAYDYITKPFRVEELRLVLQRMAEKVQLVVENQFLRDRVNSDIELHGIVGSSPNLQDVLRMVARLKDTRTPVLITGESGTGKELVARAIHFRGPFAKQPFVAVDCGSLVPTLIESELFGYEKGAFTGALKSKQGLFQAAHGGTLFLDEIAELPLEMQGKLLRVLQEKEVRPVGSNQSVNVDFRIIAATNQDLETTHREGKFRRDLYFRLNVVTVRVPPLRERKSDVPALAHWFLEGHAPQHPAQITPAAMKCLLEYDWPGNVRELQNCMERALALGNQEVIDLQDLPASLRDNQQFPPENVTSSIAATGLEAIERITIQRVFEQVKGDKVLAVKMLGISRATLYRKLKRYNILPRALHSAPN